MKTLILLSILLIPFRLFAPILTNKQINSRYENHMILEHNRALYDKVIEYTKLTEGKRLKAYLCPSNNPTIGYGHLIQKGEHFGTITDFQADSLLRVDFDKRLAFVDTSLSYSKRLAVAHFIFNVGIGNYKRSTLYKKIKAGKDISTEILKWCHYRSNGKMVKSNHLLRARKFELKLFYTPEYKYNNADESVELICVSIKQSKGNVFTFSRELSHIRVLSNLYKQ